MTPPSGRRPRRGHRPRKERRVIRVLTEGKVTEPSYLIAWARRHRHSISLSLSESGMAPETLVDHAGQHMRRRRDPGVAIRTSTRSGACLTSTYTRTYRLPSTTHGKVASKLRSPIRASNSGSCCTSKIRPRTSIGATCNGGPTNSNLHSERGFPTTRGVRCSMSSRPPDSAPKRWISGTPATDRRPGRTQALTSGGSSIGSDPLAIGNHTEMRSPLRSPVTRRPSPCREPASRHAPH